MVGLDYLIRHKLHAAGANSCRFETIGHLISIAVLQCITAEGFDYVQKCAGEFLVGCFA
jgi:hypothetical protein